MAVKFRPHTVEPRGINQPRNRQVVPWPRTSDIRVAAAYPLHSEQGAGYIAGPMPVLRFIEPCLPSTADRPPSGSNWIHEIKHDGYRLMARRGSVGIGCQPRQ